MDYQEIEQQESAEAERARSSPVSLRFEAMGCEFATMTFYEDRIVPTYHFQPVCPFGKTVPDQDCRLCRHSRIIILGTDQPYWKYRYYGHGAVFPIPDDETADAVVEALEQHGSSPLTRPLWKEGH